MAYNRGIQIIALLATALFLTGAVLVGGPINLQRKELKLTYSAATGQAVPARIMLTQAALGSFRGLFVDMLWYRVNQMKQEGQFREALQLSKWICALQPHFDKVWAFRAWDMAYNISVATHTPEERWNWVNKGINLLRNEGIAANPDSVLIKKELAWIFFHKIGNMSDDVHWYYRRKLARRWQRVLGSPEHLTTLETIARMRRVADAPDTLAQLRKNEDAVRLLDYLATQGYEADEKLLSELGDIFMFLNARDKDIIGITPQFAQRVVQTPLGQALMRKEFYNGFEALVPYLRKMVLRERYHMDARYMWKMMAPVEDGGFGFGPMDWRHPGSHGAYWSAQGIESAKGKRNKQDVDQLNTDRQIVHSMQMLMRFGRLTYDPVSDYLDMRPDPRFIESYRRAKGYADQRRISGEYIIGVKADYEKGYENFLLQAIMYCYLYGEVDRAKDYHQEWLSSFRDQRHNAQRGRMTLEQLVTYQIRTSDMFANDQQFVDAMLRNAFLQGMARGEGETFNRFYKIAREAYDKYQASRTTTVIKDSQDRMRMAAWDQFVLQTYISLMADSRISLVVRGRIWRRTAGLSVGLMHASYDRLHPIITTQARQARLNGDAILPEPKGMAEFRQKQKDRSEQAGKPGQPDLTERN